MRKTPWISVKINELMKSRKNEKLGNCLSTNKINISIRVQHVEVYRSKPSSNFVPSCIREYNLFCVCIDRVFFITFFVFASYPDVGLCCSICIHTHDFSMNKKVFGYYSAKVSFQK